MDVKHITSEKDFINKISQSSNIVVVDFTATWCGPCKIQGKIIKEYLDENDTLNSDVVFYKLDVDEVGSVANKFRITAVPTLMFFLESKIIQFPVNRIVKEKDGTKKEVKITIDKLEGVQGKEILSNIISELQRIRGKN